MPVPIDIQALLGDISSGFQSPELDELTRSGQLAPGTSADTMAQATGVNIEPGSGEPVYAGAPMTDTYPALDAVTKGGQMKPGTHADVMSQVAPHPEPDADDFGGPPDGDEDDLM